MYANEIAIPYPAMSRGAFFDLKRVEALKGPQEDPYGRIVPPARMASRARSPLRQELPQSRWYRLGRPAG